jgi:hypothetical protein
MFSRISEVCLDGKISLNPPLARRGTLDPALVSCWQMHATADWSFPVNVSFRFKFTCYNFKSLIDTYTHTAAVADSWIWPYAYRQFYPFGAEVQPMSHTLCIPWRSSGINTTDFIIGLFLCNVKSNARAVGNISFGFEYSQGNWFGDR